MPHCTTFFDTPELAGIVSSLLEKADLARLCRTSKSLRSSFRPFLWRHYTINDRKLSNEATAHLLRHAHLLRVLDIVNPNAANDAGISALAGGPSCIGYCTQLIHLSLIKNDAVFASYATASEAFFRSVLAFLNCNHSLRQLSLATRLVLDYSHLFLEAFLALENLQFLKVEMISLVPTFPTALDMAVNLLDRHPRLQHLLFGDWVGGVDAAGWVKMDYEEDGDDDFPDTCNKSEIEAMKSIEERNVEGTGAGGDSCTITYRRVKTIELPPRRLLPYPMSFLKTLFGEGLFPNLSRLLLPNAKLVSTSMETLQVGCPRLKSMIGQSIQRVSPHVVVRSSSSIVIVSER